MHRLRTASQKYSIVFALLALVIWTVLLLGISMLLPYPLLRWDPYLPQLLLDTLLAAGGIGMLSLLGDLSILRFSGKQFGKRLLVGGYFLLIGASSLIQNLASADRGTIRSPGHLQLFVLSMLMIGAAEEITFRGVIATLLFRQYGKTTSGVWFCVIASGILFGCPHFINAIGGGSAFTGVLVQAVSAVGSGMAFTAMYYRTHLGTDSAACLDRFCRTDRLRALRRRNHRHSHQFLFFVADGQRPSIPDYCCLPAAGYQNAGNLTDNEIGFRFIIHNIKEQAPG